MIRIEGNNFSTKVYSVNAAVKFIETLLLSTEIKIYVYNNGSLNYVFRRGDFLRWAKS